MSLDQNLHFNIAYNALKKVIEPSIYISDTVKKIILETDRHPFLPAIAHPLAYSDEPILLKKRCELPIQLIAHILETLYQKKDQNSHALIINAGTGFSTALLSQLFSPITTYESDHVLYARLLEKMKNKNNVSPVMSMPQTENTFDIIFMDGGARSEIAQSVINSLKPEGILLVAQPISMHSINENSCISAHNYTKPFRYPLCAFNCYTKNNSQELILDSVVCQTHLPLIFNHQFSYEHFVF